MPAPHPEPTTIVTESVQETEALGRRVATGLAAGTLVLLYGDLGSGKTAFVRGLAAGLGLDPDEVSSPTFTLVQTYRGARPLHHVDLYRLEPGEVSDLGLDDLLDLEGGVMAIEWAERLGAAFGPAVGVSLRDGGGDRRIVEIAPAGAAGHSTR